MKTSPFIADYWFYQQGRWSLVEQLDPVDPEYPTRRALTPKWLLPVDMQV